MPSDKNKNWDCGCYGGRCGCHTAFANIPRILHEDPNDEDCEECGVYSGSFHHYGCSKEICPKCGKQLTSKDCQKVCGIYISYEPLLSSR